MKTFNKIAVCLMITFLSGCAIYPSYGYGGQSYYQQGHYGQWYGSRGGYRGSKYRTEGEYRRGQCTQLGIGCPRRGW